MKKIKKLTHHQLKEKANQIRKNLVEIAVQNGAGHIAPSLSCVDILTALYYRIMNLSPDPEWEGETAWSSPRRMVVMHYM